jgi:chemotaxis methyl-accepting protein methylase
MSNAAQDYSLNAFAMEINANDFEFLRHVVAENAGIVLGPSKRQLVQGRLSRRIRELRLGSFAAYCEHVRASGPEELVVLINALTTNVTAFFRENHHFEQLAQRMLPEAMERNAVSRRIRIWSAGCSSGEEPYSIAMTVAEALPTNQLWDVKILATDIDSHMVQTASEGVYPEDRLHASRRRSARRHGEIQTRAVALGIVRRIEFARRVAGARTLRYRFLPQRDDLFRSGDARTVARKIRERAGGRRTSMSRSFRIDS